MDSNQRASRGYPRRFNLLVIAALLAGLSPQIATASQVPDSGSPSAPTAGPGGGPEISIRKPVSGVVLDRRSRPLFQASVWGAYGSKYPDGSGGSTVYTDAGGHYTIWVPAGQMGGYLWAWKSGFESRWKNLPRNDPDDPTPTLTVDFELPYSFTFSVSPENFNSVDQVLTFDAFTTAPLTELDAGGITRFSQAEAIPAGNSPVELEVVSLPGDPAGQVHWRGTWTLAANALDGAF